MSKIMMSNRLNVRMIVVAGIGCLVGYLIVNQLIDSRFNDIVTTYESEIQDLQSRLQTLASRANRIDADSVASSIASPCATDEQARFNVLLGQLNRGLNQTELESLDRLFGRCGYNDYQRKAIIVLQLTHRYREYERVIEALTVATGRTEPAEMYALDEWSALVQGEESLVRLFRSLTQQQDMIIQTLLAGANRESDEIQVILQEVQETQQSMEVLNIQLTELRQSLLNS
jgi:hypothetical protein